MSDSDFIERARRAAERLQRVREQMPALQGTEVTSDDGMVTVRLDLLGRPEVAIDRSRTHSYEEYEVKMIVIDTYNRAVRAHARQTQDAAAKAVEVLRAIAENGER